MNELTMKPQLLFIISTYRNWRQSRANCPRHSRREEGGSRTSAWAVGSSFVWNRASSKEPRPAPRRLPTPTERSTRRRRIGRHRSSDIDGSSSSVRRFDAGVRKVPRKVIPKDNAVCSVPREGSSVAARRAPPWRIFGCFPEPRERHPKDISMSP
jgi:hypothetical protein